MGCCCCCGLLLLLLWVVVGCCGLLWVVVGCCGLLLLTLKPVDLLDAFQQEMKITPLLARMELVGIALDPRYFDHWISALQAKIRDIAEEATAQLGRSLNLASVVDVAKALVELALLSHAHGSVDDYVLQRLALKHPFPSMFSVAANRAQYRSHNVSQ